MKDTAEILNVNSHIKQFTRKNITETFITILSVPGSNPKHMFTELENRLAELESPTILRMDIMGRTNTIGTHDLQQHYCYNCNGCALNHFEGDTGQRCPVAGIHVHAIQGATTRPIWLGGRLIGTEFEDDYFRFAALDNLHPDKTSSNAKQTLQLFARIRDALKSANMTLADVPRVWLFLDNILDWYDDFNQARDIFFKQHNVYDTLVPASTGVGGTNSEETAIQAAVLAAKPKSEKASVFAVPSPLQCPALDYGSSFSRAAEIQSPELSRLYVSGTASIEPGGKTIYLDDVDAQIAYTIDVIDAILVSRDMDWHDVVRGVAYVKNIADLDKFSECCKQKNLPEMPIGIVQNDICRDDLLFELEVDAIKERS